MRRELLLLKGFIERREEAQIGTEGCHCEKMSVVDETSAIFHVISFGTLTAVIRLFMMLLLIAQLTTRAKLAQLFVDNIRTLLGAVSCQRRLFTLAAQMFWHTFSTLTLDSISRTASL